MRTHRQGRTGATGVASEEAPARRLLVTLRAICRRLRLAQPDRKTRRAYREVEKALAELERQWRLEPTKRSGR